MKKLKNILKILPALVLMTTATPAVAAPAPPPAAPTPGDKTAKPDDKTATPGDKTAKPDDKTATPGDKTAKPAAVRPTTTPARPAVAPPPAPPACDPQKVCDAKKLCDAKKICDPLKVCDPKTLKVPGLVCFKKDPKKKKLADGWHHNLTLGATLAMGQSLNVPGIDDGISLTLGAVVIGSVLYKYKQHRWTSSLSLVHAWAKTPSVKPMVKSADELNIKTGYQYVFKKMESVSFVAGLQLVTSIAPGDLVLAADTGLLLNQVDGTQLSDTALRGQRYRLTDAFEPLIFKQLAGFNVRPYETLLATLDVRLSLAGWEVWASGYAVNNDAGTDELDLKELQSFQQVGIQLEAIIAGNLSKRLSYAFALELMFPMYTSVETGLSGFDLLNTDLSFQVGLKMSKWASLSYVFSAKRIPVLVDQWQIVNNLVLSFTANIL